MSPFRRVLTSIVVLPVWIVMILTGGQWCLMPGTATAHAVVSSAAMVGHAAGAHSMEHASATASEDHHASGSSQSGTPTHGPRGCASQAACSVAIAPAPRIVIGSESQVAVQPPRLHVDRLASLVAAPELPPPRA